MKNKSSKKSRAEQAGQRKVSISSAVLQSIRQHARESMQAEICGVLIGRETGSGTHVYGSVRGDGASQGGAHVTFTQQAWSRIHEGKAKYYPDSDIVGWYHSHPGFGVFLSDQDIFIHENFFSSPGSIAWVFDPHSDEEGCFSWDEGKVTPTKRYEILSEVGNENPRRFKAQIDGKPETLAAKWRYASKRKKAKILARICLYMLLVLAVLLAIWKWDDIASYYKKWTQARLEKINKQKPSPAPRSDAYFILRGQPTQNQLELLEKSIMIHELRVTRNQDGGGTR